jgi:D-glycero-alpha-D-manno-heptose-7-phosphate kinase
MIITQTPFRISFFGGGTDFPDFFKEYGGAVISTTIDKYCFVNARRLPPFFNYRTHITYSAQEEINHIDEIRHPLIRETMRRYGMDRLRLVYDADLPARSGLGTSSSFAVGLVNAFCSLKERHASKKYLADEAILLEREILKETGGIQDQIAAAFGGLNKITFGPEGYNVFPIIIGNERKQKLSESLMVFFTGFPRFSSEIQKNLRSHTDRQKNDLFEMLSLVDEAEKILTNENAPLNEFGRLLDYSWKLKKGLSEAVSTDVIDHMYKNALEAGAVGGKILGAGGGGFMLLYAEKDHQPAVRAALAKFLYIPFEFENNGSRVIHYEPEPTNEFTEKLA